MLPIETPRLLIRPLKAEDAPVLAALWADPRVTRFMGGPRIASEIQAGLEEDARLENPPALDLWPVVEAASGAVIGHCGLIEKQIDGQDEVELVYVFAASVWGKGYASEAAAALREAAFHRFGLRRLVSLIEPENAASARVAVKTGLRKDRPVLRPGGRWMDLYAMEKTDQGSMGFTRAICRLPGPDFAQGLTAANLGAPDYDRLLRQHASYLDALREAGLAVQLLDPLPGFPDAYFTEDVAVITPEIAVITRPGAPSRRGEAAHIEAALAGLRPLGRIQAPGTLEGGDVLVVDRRVFIGLSSRTNPAGAGQLAALLEPFGYACSAVPVSRGLHLKTSVTAAGEDTLLLTAELEGCPEFHPFRRLVVPPEEAPAANCLFLNGRLLVASGFPRTRDLLGQLGLPLVELDNSETRKMDGGLTCESLRL